jgi:hypothetical protein
VRIWPLVAVALLLLLSACGGGSDRLTGNAYRARLATIAKESNSATSGVVKAFEATSVAKLTAALTTFAAAEKHIGDEVGGLKAPKNAESANAELARGLRDTSSEASGLAGKIAKLPDVNAARALLAKSSQTKGGRELDEALAQLKKLGYVKSVS